MRFARLDLLRYGAFTGRSIAFDRPPDGDLTLVVGSNEAGKSTFRAALGDFLFGIREQTSYAFLHDMPELRLGASIETGAGPLELLRRKKRKDPLVRAGDLAPVDEAILQRHLMGVGRDGFERAWSLDAAGLRRGGEDILASKDELAQLLYAAGTGGQALRTRILALEAEADRLFSQRRSGQRRWYQLEDQARAAEASLKAAQVDPAAWRKLEAAAVEARELRDEARRALAELEAERALLQRIRHLRPVLADLDQVEAALAEAGPPLGMPADAAGRLDRGTADRARAIAAIERADELVEQAERALGWLPGTALPDEAAETALHRALRRLDELGVISAERAGVIARGEAALAGERAVAVPGWPAATWAARLQAAREEGDLVAALDHAGRALELATAAAAAARAALGETDAAASTARPLPDPVPPDLALPDPALVEQRQRELDRMAERLARLDAEIARAAQDVLAREAERSAFEREVELVTEQVVAEARRARARALDRFAAQPDAPARRELETAIGAVDQLLERRLLQAAAHEAWLQLGRGLATARATRATDLAERTALGEAFGRLQAELVALMPRGVRPAVYAGWLGRLDQWFRARDALDAAAAEVRRLEHAAGRVRTLLDAGDARPLRLVLAEAEAALLAARDAEAALASQARALAELEVARREAAAIEAERASILGWLASEAARLGLPAAPEPLRLALEQTAQLRRHRADRARGLDELRTVGAELAPLVHLVGSDDPGRLRRALEHDREQRRLADEQARLVARLAAIGEGRSRAQLADEAGRLDPEELAGRLRVLEPMVEAAGQAQAAAERRCALAEHELALVTAGSDAAACAAGDRADAHAAMAEVARRWLVVQSAIVLTGRVLARWRERGEAPLLRRAAAHFGALTGARYDGLVIDESDHGRLSLHAAGQGRHVPADRLSEGTRDQLWLALRLAGIEARLDAGVVLPVLADDILATFDDARALACLRRLHALSSRTQIIVLTHHHHLARLAHDALGSQGIAIVDL